MDAVSLTISLITLCRELYTAIQSIKNAREDIKAFSEELAALQRTLESVHKAFGGKQSLVLSKLEAEIGTCLVNLNKLAVTVNPDGWRARVRNTFNRSAWPLKEVETRQYIDQIYRLTSHLGLELQAYQTCASYAKCSCAILIVLAELWPPRRLLSKRMSGKKKRVVARVSLVPVSWFNSFFNSSVSAWKLAKLSAPHTDEKRFAVLRWIHPENCNDRHVHIQSERKQGTGRWLFETPEFQRWMGKESSRVLLGSGIGEWLNRPMSGQSMVMLRMVHSWRREDILELGGHRSSFGAAEPRWRRLPVLWISGSNATKAHRCLFDLHQATCQSTP